jgi:LacI family transcriptional regulator
MRQKEWVLHRMCYLTPREHKYAGGCSMITIKEIASILGVSPTTVSNVVNGRTDKMSVETRQRVEEALIEYGFKNQHRSTVKQEGLRLVAVDFNLRFKENIFTDPFCGELFDSICEKLCEYGRYPVCGSVKDSEEAYNKLKDRNIEGGIIIGFEPRECNAFAQKAGKPVVFVDCGEGSYDNIGIADYDGSRCITDYLIKQGHKRIAFFCDRKSPVASTLDRFQGYSDCLAAHGLKYENEDYYYLPDEKILRREVMRKFVDKVRAGRYTAVFVVSDLLANEAINVFKGEGLRVPEDVSVTGFDDNVYAKLCSPMLTTIRQPVKEKGRLAVRLLMQRIQGQEVSLNSFRLPVELIVRDSVKNIN